jgi:hypothetical protein
LGDEIGGSAIINEGGGDNLAYVVVEGYQAFEGAKQPPEPA